MNKSFRSKIISHLIILLVVGIISGTSAYLIIKNSVKNDFVMGEVNPEIISTYSSENQMEEDVYVKNAGNVPIYLRVAVIISWIDNDGKILETKPEQDIDYSINFSASTNWLKSDEGYYYYKNILQVNENTDMLIEECTQIKEYDDKTLEISVATQAIQAEPAKAIEEAWNVDVVDGVLVLNEE